MAWVAGLLMAAMMVAICFGVIARKVGYQSSAHLFTFTEYALLIVPCLGAPWLVREKGHIYVEIFFMHDVDVRSMDMPRWMIVGFIPLSFAMMAVEFIRFLARGEDFLGSLASDVDRE